MSRLLQSLWIGLTLSMVQPKVSAAYKGEASELYCLFKRTSDSRELVDFYRSIPGLYLEESSLNSTRGYEVVKLGNVHICLDRNQRAGRIPTLNPNHDHWAFRTDHIESYRQWLSHHGIEFLERSFVHRDTLVRQLFFLDPDGQQFEIVSPGKKQENASKDTRLRLDHISKNLDKASFRLARAHYQSLGFWSLSRPNFKNPGAWLKRGELEIHLIVDEDLFRKTQGSENFWVFPISEILAVKDPRVFLSGEPWLSCHFNRESYRFCKNGMPWYTR